MGSNDELPIGFVMCGELAAEVVVDDPCREMSNWPDRSGLVGIVARDLGSPGVAPIEAEGRVRRGNLRQPVGRSNATVGDSTIIVCGV